MTVRIFSIYPVESATELKDMTLEEAFEIAHQERTEWNFNTNPWTVPTYLKHVQGTDGFPAYSSQVRHHAEQMIVKWAMSEWSKQNESK